MNKVTLGGYVKIKTGKLDANASEENGKYPFFTCAREISRINTYAFDCECVLVAGNGELNVKYYEGKFNAYQRTYVIESLDLQVLSTKYLYYFIDSYMGKLRNGAIGGVIKYIKLNHLTDIKLPLPDLETQDKIVAILDKAKSLIDKREQTIQKFDELLRTAFLDMFGDSITNTKGWKKNSLEFLCNKIIDCPHETPEYIEGGSDYYCVRSSDIQRNYLDLKETKKVSEETYFRRISRHVPKEGQVIYTREGGRLGNAARVPKNYNICLGQRMMLFIADENVASNEFIWALLNSDSIKKQVINMSGGGAAPRINISQLRTLKVITPTIDLQNLFAKKVNKIDHIKGKLKQSLEEITNLFSSLSQKAFKGELEFNTAVDLEILLENDYEYFKDKADKKAIQLLLERLDKNELNLNKFNDQDMYDKAKNFVFELLKEGQIKQVLDKKTNRVKLTM